MQDMLVKDLQQFNLRTKKTNLISYFCGIFFVLGHYYIYNVGGIACLFLIYCVESTINKSNFGERSAAT